MGLGCRILVFVLVSTLVECFVEENVEQDEEKRSGVFSPSWLKQRLQYLDGSKRSVFMPSWLNTHFKKSAGKKRSMYMPSWLKERLKLLVQENYDQQAQQKAINHDKQNEQNEPIEPVEQYVQNEQNGNNGLGWMESKRSDGNVGGSNLMPAWLKNQLKAGSKQKMEISNLVELSKLVGKRDVGEMDLTVSSFPTEELCANFLRSIKKLVDVKKNICSVIRVEDALCNTANSLLQFISNKFSFEIEHCSQSGLMNGLNDHKNIRSFRPSSG